MQQAPAQLHSCKFTKDNLDVCIVSSNCIILFMQTFKFLKMKQNTTAILNGM